MHGDLSPSNIIVKDGKLNGIIDFGCIAIGDPACDLVIAWTFFKNQARDFFIDNLCLNKETWQRACG